MVGINAARARDFSRFALLSGGGWLADTMSLLALVSLAGWAPQSANLLSASAAAALVYWIAHHRIHAGAAHGVELRLALYLVYTGMVIVLASAALGPLAALAGRMLAVEPHGAVAAFVAKCLVTPPQLVCNYMVSRALARAAGLRGG